MNLGPRIALTHPSPTSELLTAHWHWDFNSSLKMLDLGNGWQWHMFHGCSKLMLQVPPSGFTAAHFTTKYWIAACKFADCSKKRRREQELGSSLHAILSLEQLLETASILFQCFRLVSSCTNPCSSMLAHWWCLLCRPEQKSFWEGGAGEKKTCYRQV